MNGIVVNGLSQPVSFTVDANLPLAKTRKRDGWDKKATIMRAHKIPLHRLAPVFISWVITVTCQIMGQKKLKACLVTNPWKVKKNQIKPRLGKLRLVCAVPVHYIVIFLPPC